MSQITPVITKWVCLFHLTAFCLDWRLLHPPSDFGLWAARPQCGSLRPWTSSPPCGVHRPTDRQLPSARVDQRKIWEPEASESLRQGNSGSSDQHESWGHSPVGACWKWAHLFFSLFVKRTNLMNQSKSSVAQTDPLQKFGNQIVNSSTEIGDYKLNLWQWHFQGSSRNTSCNCCSLFVVSLDWFFL